MSRINTIFSDLKKQKRAALMPFLVAGQPTLETTAEVIKGASAAGASIAEIGFPFSDPIADGPVIAAAMYEALEHGVTPTQIFKMVASLRSQTDLGLVAMVSESIVHRMGGTHFIDHAADAGFDGVIIPDLDLDAANALSDHAVQKKMAFTMLIAPTTPVDRIERIASVSHGFLYVLARSGLTGEQTTGPDIASRIEQLRSITKLPLAVGFGISTAEQVQQVTSHADAAIVGSALVRRMTDSQSPAAAALMFIENLAAGLGAKIEV